MAGPNPLPLNALLSAPLTEITRTFGGVVGAQRLSPRHTTEAVLATCSNLFWHLCEEAVNERELRDRARVSKRALHFYVDQARRSGWVSVEPGGGRARKRIRLSSAGLTTSHSCAHYLAEAERSVGARFGDDLAPLRRSLEALVSKLDLELPHYPVGYGPADATITGGGARFGRRALTFEPQSEQRSFDEWEAKTGSRLDVRSVGQDWSPVFRSDGDTVTELSLTALLSQALVAFTIDYEGSGGLSLAYAADLVRHIGDAGIEIRIRPARGAGATGNLPVHWAFAGLKRHGFATVETHASDHRRGLFCLTEKGRQVRDAYEEIADTIEQRWRRRYGESTVASMRSVLEAVDTHLDGTSPHHLLSLTTGLTSLGNRGLGPAL